MMPKSMARYCSSGVHNVDLLEISHGDNDYFWDGCTLEMLPSSVGLASVGIMDQVVV
jgi:hypothetical protein